MTAAETATSVRRREDQRFLTGTGRYLDDLALPRQCHAVFVRSPHAHADVLEIRTGDAAALPGVLGIFTGHDLEADGIGPLPTIVALNNKDGSPLTAPPHPALSHDRVRYVGDPVAIVVADTIEAARDAADLVDIDYAPLPQVCDLEAASADDAPDLWPQAPGNICLDWESRRPRRHRCRVRPGRPCGRSRYRNPARCRQSNRDPRCDR